MNRNEAERASKRPATSSYESELFSHQRIHKGRQTGAPIAVLGARATEFCTQSEIGSVAAGNARRTQPRAASDRATFPSVHSGVHGHARTFADRFGGAGAGPPWRELGQQMVI